MAVPSQAPIDPTQLEEALRRSYRGITAEPGIGQRFWGALRQLGAFVFDLFLKVLERAGGAGSLVQFLVGSLATLALLWFGWKILRRVGLVKETTALRDQGVLPPVDWRADAEAALAAGDLLQAIRCLYRLLVQSLATKGWVPDRPGLTSGECRRAVRNLPISPDIDRATRAFDAVVYGRRSPRNEDVEALRRAEALVSGSVVR